MAESEPKGGSQTDGTSGKEGTQEKTVRMSDYQELQRQNQKLHDENKAFKEKQREGESVEDALKREREENARLNRDLGLERAKRTAPETLHGLIDRFVEKHGFVPDAEDIELLKSNLKPAEAPPGDGKQEGDGGESSGMRNGGSVTMTSSALS
jgi:predicted nuclease with TOPRIM domain